MTKLAYIYFALFALCSFIPYEGRSANVSDCLIELSQPPVIDGNLEDWAKKPFIVCGANLPSEGTDAAVVWRGWDKNNFYFAAQVFDDVLLSGWDRIDIYFDLRAKERLGRYPYEQGVWHIRVLPKTGKGTQPTIMILSPSGDFLPAKSAQVKYALQTSKAGWNVEVAIPWQALEFDPETVGSINTTFSITDGDTHDILPMTLLGTIPPDIRNHPNTDPITFETLSLHETPLSFPGMEIYCAETVWNHVPVIHIRAASYEPKFATESLKVEVVGQKAVSYELPFLTSLSGRFRTIDRYLPFADSAPTQGKVTLSITPQNNAAKREEFSVPIYAEHERINTAIPTKRLRGTDAYTLLAAYYKELALEATAEMSTDRDTRRVRQRQLRSQNDPGYWRGVVDLYIRWSIKTLQRDIPAWLPEYHHVWKATDGNLNVLKITTPSTTMPANGYPLIVDFPYGDINNERIRTYFDLLALENGTLSPTQSDGIWVRLTGRGYVENSGTADLLGDEEFRTAVAYCRDRYKIDPSKIVFEGHSSGASYALRYAVEYPGDLSAADLRAGYFEAPSESESRPDREKLLYNKLYRPAQGNQVLHGKQIRIISGALDAGILDSSIKLSQALLADGIKSDMIELKDTHHNFAYPLPPLDHLTASPTTLLCGIRPEGRLRGSAVEPFAVAEFAQPWSLRIKDNVDAFESTTSNLSSVDIDLSKLQGRRLIIDGQNISVKAPSAGQHGVMRLRRIGHSDWRKVDNNIVEKSWGRVGPAVDIRNRPLKIVYGTKTPEARAYLQTRAEFIVHSLTGIGALEQPDFFCQVVADTDVSVDDIENGSLWILGNENENRLTARFARERGVTISPEGFKIGNREFSGKLFASILCPNGANQYALLQMATTPSAYAAPVMPDWQYDYTVLDCSKPFEPPTTWGFFDEHWAFKAELSFEGGRP